jgi:cytochrome c
MLRTTCLSIVLILTTTAAWADEAAVAHGKALYAERCMSCHSAKYNGVGPMHLGVVGRRAGSVPNFEYSAALKASGLTWTRDNLDRWLSNPEAMVPGQKMGVSVANAQERADLIAFLATLRQE